MKFHLEIDPSKLKIQKTESSPQVEKKRKAKKTKTGLRKRKDVVFKALLRKIRSYYWKNFNHTTHYNVLKKNPHPTLYKECLKVYLDAEFAGEQNTIVNEELVLTLGDLMTSEGASNLSINETYLTLYKFSIARLLKLVGNPKFMTLIHHFSDIFDEERLTKDEKKGLQMIKDEGLFSSKS